MVREGSVGERKVVCGGPVTTLLLVVMLKVVLPSHDGDGEGEGDGGEEEDTNKEVEEGWSILGKVQGNMAILVDCKNKLSYRRVGHCSLLTVEGGCGNDVNREAAAVVSAAAVAGGSNCTVAL